MRHALRSSIGCVALALLSSGLEAQPADPKIYCASGDRCFAMAFETSGTTSTLFLQNLQGSFPLDPASAPFFLGDVWLLRDNRGSNAGTRVEFFSGCWGGAVGSVHPPASERFCFAQSSYSENIAPATQWRHYNGRMGSGPILGCTYSNSPGFGHSTCPRDGFDGWYYLTFNTGVYDVSGTRDFGFLREFSMEDVEFEIGPCTFVGTRSGYANPGTNCAVFPYAALTAVPEPSTYAMLGTGLLGLGGLALRRRHRVA